MATRKELLARIGVGGPPRPGDVFRSTLPNGSNIVFIAEDGMGSEDGVGSDAVSHSCEFRGALVDIGRRIIDGGLRPTNNCRRHAIVEYAPGKFTYIAGCRSFKSLKEALDHWARGNSNSDERPWKRAKAKELFRQAYKLGYVTAAVAGVMVKPIAKAKRVRAIDRKKARR